MLRRVSAGAYRTRTQASQTRAPFGLHSVQTLHSHVALVGASLVSAFSVLAGPRQNTSESGTSARAAIGPVCFQGVLALDLLWLLLLLRPSQILRPLSTRG